MKARIPKHREFIINFPDSIDNAKANEGWAKLQQIVEDYKKAHTALPSTPHLHRGLRARVKKLQEEYGFELHRRVRSVSSEFQYIALKEQSVPASWLERSALFVAISVPY